MRVHLISALALTFVTGVCFAQAPVVDVNLQGNPLAVAPVANVTSSDIEQRLAVIERIVESRSDSQQRLQQQLDMLQADVDSINGSIELHNHQLEKILERQRELFLELEKRFEGMQQQSMGMANSLGNSANAGVSNTMADVAPVQNEQEAYQSAVNLILKDRDYENAVPAFQAFLTRYPNSSLTDNAHYWLGQLLYNNQDWDAAGEQFMQVADKFASSPKRSDSLLKLGMIAKNQGNAELAKQYFEQVVAEYPNSTPARLASEQLTNG
ncbi:tol-pal system protein YbgF [Glaciecola sp. SC05]|uniref:tol-pal system protein YbgF n=1 Tax=Glaciecola sp. SC05 TaxID=1987355 RepID=UPI003527AD18